MLENISQYAVRLLPGQDLKVEIEKTVIENKIAAGCVLSIVGSLSKATLRLADGKAIKFWEESFEIVSGTGTLSADGCHIHVAVADCEGKVIGGHLKEGCIINTTAEVVLLIFNDVKYSREDDSQTGFKELVVK
ncbi:MAG: PPC domain-containing DNA-binding protein [Patescibacteria group bacterium]